MSSTVTRIARTALTALALTALPVAAGTTLGLTVHAAIAPAMPDAPVAHPEHSIAAWASQVREAQDAAGPAYVCWAEVDGDGELADVVCASR